MPAFNFTLRATDDTGAYADREFSINVNNTLVDRLVAVTGSTGYSTLKGNSWGEWTIHSGMNSIAPSSILNGGGLWLALPTTNTNLAYKFSRDAQTWENGTFPASRGFSCDGGSFAGALNYMNGYWYLVAGASKTTQYLYRSLNLVEWEQVSSTPIFAGLANTYPKGICAISNTKLFISGTYSTGQTYYGGIYNLEDHTIVNVSGAPTVAPQFVQNLNGLLVMNDNAANRIHTSSDGINWTQYPITNFGCSVAYGNGVIVLSLQDKATDLHSMNYCYRSVNGTSWSLITIPPSGHAFHSGTPIKTFVTFANGRFYMVGSNNGYTTGSVWVSKDGATWSAAAPAGTTFTSISGIKYF